MARAKQKEEAAPQEQTVELPSVEQTDDAIEAIDKVNDSIEEEVPAGTPYSNMPAWKIREEYTRITGLIPADDYPLADMIQVMFNNFMIEQQMGYQIEVMQDQIARGVFTA